MTDNIVPAVVAAQLAQYQADLLITQQVCCFDAAEASRALERPRDVLAIDIGGDKLRHAVMHASDGRLQKQDETVFRSKGGAGYLERLERLAQQARERQMVVGISAAIKLDGSRIARTVNLPILFRELTQRYDADFANLFPERAFVANDTVAGVCGAATRLGQQQVDTTEIAFVICASGMGAAVIADGTAIQVEVGHVPVEPELNPLGQTTPCGVEGRAFVCVERVTAGRAGIEDLYRRTTGRSLEGVAIGEQYARGEEPATTLYETSALALAHAVAGLQERYGFGRQRTPVAVLHGGNFEMPRYRDAVQRNLARMPGPASRVVFSRELSDNVCLDGAATLALIAHGT